MHCGRGHPFYLEIGFSGRAGDIPEVGLCELAAFDLLKSVSSRPDLP
jgi:hypothetical protein